MSEWRLRYVLATAVILFAVPTLAGASEIAVDQRDMQFVPDALTINVGDSAAAMLSALAAVLAMLLAALICGRIAGRVGGQLERAEEALLRSQEELEARVVERTRELRLAKELLYESRFIDATEARELGQQRGLGICAGPRTPHERADTQGASAAQDVQSIGALGMHSAHHD